MLWSDPCKSDLIRSVLATVASCPESIKVHHHHIFDANGCRGNPELVQRIPTARSKPVKSRFSVARSDIPKTGGGGGGGGCLSSSASNSWLRPTPCNLVAKPEIFISGIIRGQARPFIGPGFVQGALKLLEPSPCLVAVGAQAKGGNGASHFDDADHDDEVATTFSNSGKPRMERTFHHTFMC